MPKFNTIKKIYAQNGNAVGRVDIYNPISDVDPKDPKRPVVSPGEILKQLNALGKISEIECHVFCAGGNMFAGLALYDVFMSRPENKVFYVEGMAASAATLPLCAGYVYMSPCSQLFIHNPEVNAGYVNEHIARDVVDELVKYKEPMITAYMKKTGRTREEIISLMDGKNGLGTWLTADEAIVFGLADAITPEIKLPLEIAAMVAPGVFNYKGNLIDVSMFDEAAEKTAGIINVKRGGNLMAFWNKNKPVAKAKPKAEIVFTETVCPSCGGAVNLNTETGEVIAGQTKDQPATTEQSPNANAKVFARRMLSNVRNAIFTVQCPHCGSDYVWDTDANQDGSEGTETQETVPLGASQGKSEPAAPAKPQAPAQAPAQAAPAQTVASPAAAPAARVVRQPKAELASALCPGCGAEIMYDTATTETGIDPAGTEGYLITCPECNTQFFAPLVSASPAAIPAGTTAQAAYRMGVKAERERMLALDEMALAAPENEAMILAAKRSGSSVEAMSRNIIKAIAANKADRARGDFIQALQRDVEASGVQTLRKPQIHDKQAAYAESVFAALEDR